ncbi:MAG: hypothetical protein ISR83_04215 [Candidatus Marinimicrobia bacterium]|nr:hypothetical protein [Candidatus Neomarinimicrobiota bacterium]
MKLLILVGAILITVALVLYTKAMFGILKTKIITKKQLFVLSVGFLSEIVAVACMGAVSTKSIFSAHSLLGYAGALFMLAAIVWGWKTSSNDDEWEATILQYNFYRFVYIFWVISYITGVYSATLR